MNEIENLLSSLREYKNEEVIVKNTIVSQIDLSEEFLLDNIKTYNDVCKYLNESCETSPYLQIKQIEKLFNGNWVKDFSKKQKNWYPYFIYDKVSGCLGFYDSFVFASDFDGQVAFYKSEQISNFVGKTFEYIYNKL